MTRSNKETKSRLFALLCLLLTAVLLLPSCTVVSAAELSKDYSRKETEPGEIAADFPEVYRNFAFTLYDGIGEGEKLISPLSAMLCIGMIENGMSGETLADTGKMFGTDRDTMNRSLYALVNSLSSDKDCRFTSANSLWCRDTHEEPLPSFLQTNADWYGAEVYRAAFDNSTLKDVNKWAEKKTDGMIKELPIEFEADDVMLLMNAVCFDAKWETTYESDQVVENRTFTSADGRTKTVTMLSSEERTWMENDRFIGFSKNYRGNGWSFAAFLPKEGHSLSDMDAESYAELLAGKTNDAVSVLMPEFAADYHFNFTDTLKAAGMEKAFSSDADFSAMYAENHAHLRTVEQNTFIDVSRNGTKAAAVTWGMMNKEAEIVYEKEIVLDRPFVYAIVDNATGLPVFLGTVTGENF